MYLVTLLSCLFLVNAKTIVGTTIDSNTTCSSLDALRNQVNNILVQISASEIDRNRTASAIVKLGQFADANESIKDVVQFFTENYENNFDNLLYFIDHISSIDLQQSAYNALTGLFDSDGLHLVNVLRFDDFVRVKLELAEKIDETHVSYKELRETILNQMKKLMIETDLNEVKKYADLSKDSDRIFELLPNLAKGLDLSNFTAMDKIFELSVQLPKPVQIKLIGRILSEMQSKSQKRHIYHVISQIIILKQLMERSRLSEEDICSLAQVEKEIPSKLRPMLGSLNLWGLQNLATKDYIAYRESRIRKSNDLFLSPEKRMYGSNWMFRSTEDDNNNSVLICFSFYNVLTVGNQSSPLLAYFRNDRYRPDTEINRSSYQWYLFMSDDLESFLIKNTYTNEYLIANNQQEVHKDDLSHNILLSSEYVDGPSYKWVMHLDRRVSRDTYKQYGCPIETDQGIEYASIY